MSKDVVEAVVYMSVIGASIGLFSYLFLAWMSVG